jgi:hypothetical protein
LLFLRSVFSSGGIEEVECRPRAPPGSDTDGARRPVRLGLLPGRPRWTGGPCRTGLSHAKNCQRHHRAHRAARSREKGTVPSNLARKINIACAIFEAVLGIHDILLRIQIPGSVTLTNGSGMVLRKQCAHTL